MDNFGGSSVIARTVHVMTQTAPPRTTGSTARIVGIILLTLAAITTVPAALAGLGEQYLVPEFAPPEAFLIPSLALMVMQLTWWLQAALIVTGLVLSLSAPRRLVPGLLGAVTAVCWFIAMAALSSMGMLWASTPTLGA